MYYDRKNIIPDYLIHANFHIKASSIGSNAQSNATDFKTHLTLENVGRRPVAINRLKIKIHEDEKPSKYDIVHFESGDTFIANNILIESGQIWNGGIQLQQDDSSNNRYFNGSYLNQMIKYLYFSPLEIHLANGEVLYADIKIIK